MSEHTGINGTPLDDEDIERWAAEAESEQGYTGGHLGPAVAGRPISVGVQACHCPLRLDAARRAKLDEVAKGGTPPSPS